MCGFVWILCIVSRYGDVWKNGIWLFFTDKRMFCIGFLAKMQTCPQFDDLLLQGI